MSKQDDINTEASTTVQCDCPTPEVFHYSGCAVLIARFNERTADGVPITDGLAVWDYNREAGYVSLRHLGEDGWFHVCKPGQDRGSLMNNVRVCVRDPYTRQLASDALALLRERHGEQAELERERFNNMTTERAA